MKPRRRILMLILPVVVLAAGVVAFFLISPAKSADDFSATLKVMPRAVEFSFSAIDFQKALQVPQIRKDFEKEWEGILKSSDVVRLHLFEAQALGNAFVMDGPFDPGATVANVQAKGWRREHFKSVDIYTEPREYRPRAIAFVDGRLFGGYGAEIVRSMIDGRDGRGDCVDLNEEVIGRLMARLEPGDVRKIIYGTQGMPGARGSVFSATVDASGGGRMRACVLFASPTQAREYLDRLRREAQDRKGLESSEQQGDFLILQFKLDKVPFPEDGSRK